MRFESQESWTILSPARPGLDANEHPGQPYTPSYSKNTSITNKLALALGDQIERLVEAGRIVQMILGTPRRGD
jgi:hypothetical protein